MAGLTIDPSIAAYHPTVGSSPYIAAVRAKLGTDLLFIPAAGMAVFDDEGRLLLARELDGEPVNDAWGRDRAWRVPA